MATRTVLLLGRYKQMMDMGGVPLSSGNKKLAKSLTKSLSKRLKVRGVLFDYNVITNHAPENIKAEEDESSRASSSESSFFRLPQHVADMAAVLGVNVAATDKGVSLGRQEEREKIFSEPEAMNETIDLSRRTSKKESQRKLPADVAPPGADDVRAKYMAKLKAKKGISASQILGTSGQAGSATASDQDSTFHLSLRDSIVSAENNADPNKYSNSGRWLPVSGMGRLLQYTSSRSIKIGIMSGSPLLASYKAGDVQEYQKQLGKVDFDFVFEEGVGNNGGDAGALVAESIKELDVEAGVGDDLSGVMVVSQETEILKAARDANSYTCYVIPLNGRRCGISTNYTIKTISELRDCVDDVNGVSFNNVRKVDYGIDHGSV